MFKAIWSFIKAFGDSVHKNTIAPIKRWVINSKDGNADDADKRTASRVLTYLGLLVSMVWFPQIAIVIAILRGWVFTDILGVISSVVVDTFNLLARKRQAAV